MRAVVALLLLAGCTAVQDQPTCNADNWEEFVGQPEAAIYGALANLRVVREGEAITQDYNADRLNAEIAADGTISRFACY